MKKTILTIMILVVAITSVAMFAACGDKDSVKMIDIELTSEEYGLGVKKGNTAILNEIDGIMDEIKDDIQAITDKYLAGEEDKFKAVTPAKLDKSKVDSQLVVVTNAEFAPFEYTLDAGKTFLGIDMEVAKIIADKLEKELVIIDTKFESIVQTVETGAANYICAAAMTITPARKETLDFTKSYYNASQVLVVASENKDFDDCKTAEDVEKVLKGLEGAKAGYQSATTGEAYINGDPEDTSMPGFSNIEGKPYDNPALAAQDLVNGNIQILVVDKAPAQQLVKSMAK